MNKYNIMNKDIKNIGDAYEMLLEAKKKLSPAQKKIAAQAPPPDEITGADFKALKGKKKVNENMGTWGIEGKIKEALQEVESVGYTGDSLDPMQMARLVVGLQGNWGEEYEALIQSLAHVIEAYYEKGLQDS